MPSNQTQKYPIGKSRNGDIFSSKVIENALQFLQNDWEFPPIINNKNNLLEIIFGGMDSSNVSGNSSLKTKITI